MSVDVDALARKVDELRADTRFLAAEHEAMARLVERQARNIDQLQRALVALDKAGMPHEPA